MESTLVRCGTSHQAECYNFFFFLKHISSWWIKDFYSYACSYNCNDELRILEKNGRYETMTLSNSCIL